MTRLMIRVVFRAIEGCLLAAFRVRVHQTVSMSSNRTEKEVFKVLIKNIII